ncbi:MAG: HDIG domain-containing protein [Rhodothermaceae bacterium]|nr:HDIG domain-containing protein [Rhodothermaceae bacterium]MYD19910.1 HDIG domain-containing protein [Rhodothermaceae bacterium]MYD57502.1 HDIG domain-containing protein [Rhodothermaceae bacterium]MYJ55605.1 HDIG domain-containing protein [Rhodothermaceae bacterium]
MKYWTSYGENESHHRVEVARLCSLMVAEMELGAHIARRTGLLYDIGKEIPESEDRSHELVGMEYCKLLWSTRNSL